jgi:protein-S-isoprenylcysteine O-methyltransferase Ste14
VHSERSDRADSGASARTPDEGMATGTSGVVARPPLLFLGALLLAHGGDHLLPLSLPWPLVGHVRCILAGLLVLLGAATTLAGIRDFVRADTPVPTNRPTRALVVTGAHGRSRNPIYIGMFAIYLGIGFFAASAWTMMLLLPLALIMRYGVVAREEVYLERLFGEDYRAYKSRVRRWL